MLTSASRFNVDFKLDLFSSMKIPVPIKPNNWVWV